MVFGEIEPDRLVCHYTTARTFFDYIEPAMRIRVGPMTTVNDPRESRDWYVTLVADTGEQVDDREFMALQREFNAVARGATLLLCCTNDPGDGRGDTVENRGFAHPAMWSHYGDVHRGLCLLLDRAAIHAAFEELVDDLGATNISGPVTYRTITAEEQVQAFTIRASRIQTLGLREAVREHLQAVGHVLYRRKHPDWAAEDEYRWVLFDPRRATLTEALLPITNALVGLVVGDCFESSPAWDRTLQQLFREGMPIARMHWRNGLGSPIPLT